MTLLPDAEEVLATLLALMQDSESDSVRIAAAKVLLERLSPKEDDEIRQREAEERQAAIGEARCLLAELAVARTHELYSAPAMDGDGAAGAIDAAARGAGD
ncbi:MAG: hypothetical protein JO126_04520 [Alphaproteobacteria bacterium]|nr:hypothetical protein [Alphaproteobacteria bacterium]MBV8548701.1 hypothetical protein [Alphaproteobacteria bacterium]